MGTSAEQLKIIARASEFHSVLKYRTSFFPPAEQFMLVPILLDSSLSVIENISYAQSITNPFKRIDLFKNSLLALEQVHARLVLCKRTQILDLQEFKSLEARCNSIRHEIGILYKQLTLAMDKARRIRSKQDHLT
jgi:hypothetical protein